ncbi:hypothetical protein BO71DRAFT_481949 [Aspergillus ellipticus CBS 707.79]|uniref:NAD(P)-binding protein n=1 Tax=Aspergillus ellipticus CBS 707.79 TaxID=1448320 RepID=A0A319DGC7_9EURO|nr:hypothetical protein BO71DRAFT_481949 [Aspergillus ellipticus CBS 707.79]
MKTIFLAQDTQEIQSQYPEVEVVHGRLEDSEILIRESARADIIIHTDAPDYLRAAEAIAQGAVEGHSPERPVYWVHMSSAAIFGVEDEQRGLYGVSSDRVWDDVDDIQQIVSSPEGVVHRGVDKVVLSTGTNCGDVVKTAIVSLGGVYGQGRGPCSQHSQGLSKGTGIHVFDATKLVVLLVEAVLVEREDGLWGPEAYYLAGGQEFQWKFLAEYIRDLARSEGLAREVETEALGYDDAVRREEYSATWGLNVCIRGTGARQLLGWQPQEPWLMAALLEVVYEEYRQLPPRIQQGDIEQDITRRGWKYRLRRWLK